MRSYVPLLFASLSATVWSSPHPRGWAGAKPACKELLLPVEAAANNTVYPAYPNSTAPGVYLEWLGSFNASTLPTKLVSGKFDISAIYCEPTVKVKGREGTIQFLVHGLAETKLYWNGQNYSDPTFQGEYSWLYHATSQGYATLAIDNLGNGNSAHPDPVEVVQSPLQLSVIYEMLAGIRKGSLPGIPAYNKIVYTGHSYGTVLGRILAQLFPTSGADAYVLTGSGYDFPGIGLAIQNDFHAQSASAVDPRHPHLAPAYLSVDNAAIKDSLFGLEGQYDPKMLAAAQASPHIFPIGEIAASETYIPTNFTGPVLILTGQMDQIVCGNGNISSEVPNCDVGPSSIPYKASTLFPKARPFKVYSPKDTAHSLNTQYSAPETFGAAHSWLASVGF